MDDEAGTAGAGGLTYVWRKCDDFPKERVHAESRPGGRRIDPPPDAPEARRHGEGDGEGWHRALFEHASDLIVVLGADGGRRFVSPSVTRLLGYSMPEYLAFPTFELVHPDDHVLVQTGHIDSLAHPGPQPPFRCRILHADGSWRSVEATRTNLLSDPLIHGMVITLRDVTDAEDARRRLFASEAQFRSAFSFAAIGMALVGLDGRWLTVNRALCALTGYTRDELLTRSFQDITHPDDAVADRAHAEGLLAGRIETFQLEKRYVRKDGETVWVLVSVSLVHDERGQPLHFISQVQDIAVRKRAESALVAALVRLEERGRALEAKTREQEAFNHTVSHDLRAPLVSLQGLANIILEDHAAAMPGEARRHLDRIVANADKMQALIADLPELARVGHAEDDRAPVDLGTVVRDVMEQLGHTLAARGADERIAGELPTVWVNRARMSQLFTNLIDNAVAYTPPERTPEVRIAAEERPDCWEFTVRDNGIGIPAAWQEKVFGLFQRLPAGKALNPGGSGAGLAIVARVMETHGGRLWLESAEGAGTTFHLALPKRTASLAGSRADADLAAIAPDGLSAA
ncbi:MAG: sensor histidine kinase [Thermomicrobiales bacterium]